MTTLPGQRYDQYGFVVGNKGQRPEVRRGAAVLMAGAAVHFAATFMPWYTDGDVSLNGLDTFINVDGNAFTSPGTSWIVVGLLLFVAGAVSFFGRRHLAVAIAAVVIAVLGLFTALLGVGVAASQKDAVGSGDASAGAFVGIVGMLGALAGAVQILSKRRR